MIRKILFLTIFAISFFANAQFTLAIDGNNVTDGTVLNYSGIGDHAGNFDFIVTNTAGMPITVTMTLESMTNNTAGANLQFCWNLCYDIITVNSNYPPAFETLPMGASSAPVGNHFYNNYLGDDTTSPVEYVFRFHEVNASGVEIGSPIRITYRYQDTTAVAEYNQVEFELFPTVAQDSFTLKLQENVHGTIVNLNGQTVQEFNALTGENTIDISNLASQLYYINLTNEKNQKSNTKLIIN